MPTFDESFDIETAAGLFCPEKNWPLAMAYVPWQQWCDLYDETKALERGTLFPDLDKPFLGGRGKHNG